MTLELYPRAEFHFGFADTVFLCPFLSLKAMAQTAAKSREYSNLNEITIYEGGS